MRASVMRSLISGSSLTTLTGTRSQFFIAAKVTGSAERVAVRTMEFIGGALLETSGIGHGDDVWTDCENLRRDLSLQMSWRNPGSRKRHSVQRYGGSGAHNARRNTITGNKISAIDQKSAACQD